MMKPLEAPVTRMVLLFGLAVALVAAPMPPGTAGGNGGSGGGRSSAPAPRSSAPPSRPSGPVYGSGPSRSMVQDPHFMARLYQIRVTRIQQVLGVPEDRAKVVAERWGRWDREHMDRGDQAADLRKQFNQILLCPEKEEEKNAKLKPLLDQFMSLRQQQETGRKQFEEDVRSGLTPAQQARLILVMEEIQQRLREGLRDVQRK